ncbi:MULTISPECIES: MFS transporter [Methanobacterium]|jgi:EmrB/QacA subfamily drug resistance transporter|uniref:MFS transporter n=1 Tax=Methanobacterium bryantii TaxID=2161 RepID=A0A2A2H325_METBR|nr:MULTISPECIES: MFS transporter [Methanobacterium]OEC87676.1 MFS transporter [Methanobacterium sp. A39]PAV03686.1 MFS transporter [Methanobacterium bryantii]
METQISIRDKGIGGVKGEKVNKTAILLIATLASFLTPFMGTSLNVALPTISSELTVNAILLSWITTAFFLTSAMFAVPFGKIADIYGMKKIFTYGIVILTVASFLAAVATSAEFLIITRVVQGIGSAMIFVTGLAIITSIFPSKERGKAIGINITAVYVGLVMGPVLGGFLTQYLGWRSIFCFVVPLGLLVIALVLWKMNGKEWAACKGEKLDYWGSLLYILMLALILIGFSNITGTLGMTMVILGIVGFIGFVIWELKVENPVLEIKLFLNNRMFAFSNLATLISYMGLFAVGFLLSLYLQFIKGFDPNVTGLILVVQTAFMVIISPFAGRLSDKFDSGKLASLGMGIITIGLLIFAIITAETSVYVIILGLAILGIGVGIFSAPNTHTIMGSVERKYFGLASATVSTMRLLGQTFGMGLILAIFAVYVGAVQFNSQNYPELLTSIQVAFSISVILSIIAVFASLARNRK